MARRAKKPVSRFDRVPSRWRVPLTIVTLLGGALWLLAAALLLGALSWSIGFAPSDEVYRTGTVTVTSCGPMGRQQIGMYACRATVGSWQPARRSDIALSDSKDVIVYSRSPLSGTVEVVSHAEGSSAPQGGTVYTEAIIPADQTLLPAAAKVALVIGCVLLAFVGTFVTGRIAWEIALRRSPAA